MLLVEWQHWYSHIAFIKAQEWLEQRQVAVVADAGWDMPSRQEILEAWQELADGARPVRGSGLPKPKDDPVAREIRQLFGWLRERWDPTGRDKHSFAEA